MISKHQDTNLHIIIIASDLLANLIGIVLAFYLRYQLVFGTADNFDQVWIVVLILGILIIVDIMISPIHDFSKRGPFIEMVDVAKHQIIGIAFAIITLYLAHSAASLSRLVFVYFLISSILLVWIFRLLVKRYLTKIFKKGNYSRKLLIVSNSENIDVVKNRVKKSNDWDVSIEGTINVDERGYEYVVEYATHNLVDEILIYLPLSQRKENFKDLIDTLVSMGIRVNIGIPQLDTNISGIKGILEIGSYTTLSVCRNSLTIGQQAIKRMVDVIGGALGTLFFAIVFVILGPIIKIDSPGPVLFKQKRVGKNGRVFDFYKFRSMNADAEQRKNELKENNEMSGLMFKIDDDPRITNVGKFIRRTSLDELPQFWNVFSGDMSLVGTRPPTIDEYKNYKPWHKSRLSMKPGITGLWQVSGRSDIKNFEEVVALDMEYIDNWSVLNDLKILGKTVVVVFTGKGAK